MTYEEIYKLLLHIMLETHGGSQFDEDEVSANNTPQDLGLTLDDIVQTLQEIEGRLDIQIPVSNSEDWMLMSLKQITKQIEESK